MQISSSDIVLQVSPHGAELTSFLVRGQQLLWQADPQFWRRHAPILFPIVGKVFNNTYHVDGQLYQLPQHGFARDSQFQLINQSPTELELQLSSSPDTLKVYPYPFTLTAHYQLCQSVLTCRWTVHNPGERPLYFQLGAHPAFNFLDFAPQNPIYGYLQFYRQGAPVHQLTVTRLSASGHATQQTYALPLPDGLLAVTPQLFQHDALVLEGSQADRVVLLDRHRRPYLQTTFQAPVLGIWSPVAAPFCCIEPWYGRTDPEGFAADISQRAYIQALPPQQSFTFTYTIQAL